MEIKSNPPTGGTVEGTEITIAATSRYNKWRDIGLYIAISLIFITMFAGWLESEKRRSADFYETKERGIALDKVKGELEALQKTAADANKFKAELSKEFTTTRKMLFEAWKNNKEDTAKLQKQIEALQRTVNRIEKTKSEEECVSAATFLATAILFGIDIKFPVEQPKVQPVPPPTPVVKLTANALYVVESDDPFFLLASPPNLVALSEDAGPLKVRAVFADSDGKTVTRTYKSKHLFIVEAAGVGTVELIAFPQGITDATKIVRKTLYVDNGQGPRPPPGPSPEPVPPPTPADPYFPLDGKTRVLMLYDSNNLDKLTAAQRAAVDGVAVREWLDSHCAPDGYRIWPSTVKGVENTPALWQKAFAKASSFSPLPVVLISNGKGAEVIQQIPTDGVMPVLKKVGGE